jgi:hypothetical protein
MSIRFAIFAAVSTSRCSDENVVVSDVGKPAIANFAPKLLTASPAFSTFLSPGKIVFGWNYKELLLN